MDLANNCSSQQSAGKGWAYLVGAHRRRRAQRRQGIGRPRQGPMAAVAESPVAMVAVGEEPPVEVVTAAAHSSSWRGTSRPSICDGLEWRRWALCVRSLDPLPIGGLWCGSILARGTVWPNGLTAWPAPFTILVGGDDEVQFNSGCMHGQDEQHRTHVSTSRAPNQN
jgi:hypothetical protein